MFIFRLRKNCSLQVEAKANEDGKFDIETLVKKGKFWLKRYYFRI